MTNSMHILQIVRTHFVALLGENPTITALPGERDKNFGVSGRGVKAILKICSPEDLEHLQLQDRALRSLSLPSSPKVLHEEIVTLDSGALVRLVSWLDGSLWAESDLDDVRRFGLGQSVAELDRGLSQLELDRDEKTILQQTFRWNMMQATDLLDEVDLVVDFRIREICRQELTVFVTELLPILESLPFQMIHNDANERNIIVGDDTIGLIDFGDIVFAPRIVGLATAMAYAAIGLHDPIPDVIPVLRGYNQVTPLTTEEAGLIWPLVRIRLVMSIINAAVQSSSNPDNEYLLVSQNGVLQLLNTLVASSDYLALCRAREACGYEPSPRAHEVRHYLRTSSATKVVSVNSNQVGWIDWSTTTTDPRDEQSIANLMAQNNLGVMCSRYGEERDAHDNFPFDNARRRIHLGVDLFQKAGCNVYAPFAGVVEQVRAMQEVGDFGHGVLLRHITMQGTTFWTLYGNLTAARLTRLDVGQSVNAGDVLGQMGQPMENGGWPPHVHVQVLTDLCGMGIDIFGTAPQDEMTLWRSICPNPNLFLGIASGDTSSDAHAGRPTEILNRERTVRLSRALSLNFREPLHIVRGEGAYLFDIDGRSYLDLVNNVAHVGHGHPQVVAAAARQMYELNTNTRFLHDAIVEYGSNLTATLPDPLSVVFFVNSGSEANDLAIRLARAYTRARGWISLKHAYHGHTASVLDISPYKFLGAGGAGAPSNVRVAELPDAFRGRHTGSAAGQAYAKDFAKEISDLDEPLAAFIAEGVVSTAGQVTLAEGFLAGAYEQTRSAGGVCIADEVQIGLGRLGERFWGFELHDVVPDIVTMGKPMGNGHPLAAVVTTPAIAAAFNNGMEYFNTFGGNPVSATIGQAVLDVVFDSRLQSNAQTLGSYLQDQVRVMQSTHGLIGDVRGHGLFIGIELMREEEPAGDVVANVIEYAKQRGVMLSSDGPDNNVFKIKPPMVVQREDIDMFLDVFDQALTHLS
ncbi:MAG: aminotransferase class III-fold pyridoxal phosphate-dependent enzyme [Actinomycetes bacterium]